MTQHPKFATMPLSGWGRYPVESCHVYRPEKRSEVAATLASGQQSNYYFNCKPTTLDPEGMNLIGIIVFDMIKDYDITAAGGLTLGADPIAYALSLISYQKGKPVKSFIVRKDVKAHGTKSAVEGNVAPGAKVVIIDDVITTGG